MKKRQNKLQLVVAALLILIVGALCGGLLFLESTVLYPEEDVSAPNASKTISRNGIDYFPRQNMTVVLVMGIDEPGPARDSLSYNNKGEADMVLLAVLDEGKETCSFLALNRDTMMEIPVLGLGGKQAGTRTAQLALAHTYGSGLEDSCENVRKAVSHFLNDIEIDYYVSMNLDAISILNDAVGGVTVTVEDDFSLVDENIRQGTMVLKGAQAQTFVQTRWGVGDHLNLSRMERQKEYMKNLMEALLEKTRENDGFIRSTYEQVAPYLVSDLPVSTLSSMAERYEGYAFGEVISLEGENVLGEEYYEFYPDMEKLDELILQLFYAPK